MHIFDKILTNMAKILIPILAIVFLTSCGLKGQFPFDNTYAKVVITTDSGDIHLILYPETKLHRENFIKLIKEGFYDSLQFHRLIKDFMIQGGDPNSKNADKGELLGKGGTGYIIPAEILHQYYHKKGALAAARKGDQVNPNKESNGSQFYIVQGRVFTDSELDDMVWGNIHTPFSPEERQVYTTIGGTPHLDGSYTVFGEVESGLEVLDKLMNIPTDAYDRPVLPIVFSIRMDE
jgi:cyclophilin family peptidyl-prolyl cis-trans isomerase